MALLDKNRDPLSEYALGICRPADQYCKFSLPSIRCCAAQKFTSLFPAVISAVIFMGDDFGFVNAVGLVVLVFGAGLFNYSKYQKMVEKDKMLTRTPGKPLVLPA